MPVKITHRARIREVKQAVGGTSQRIRDELKRDLQAYGNEHVAHRQRFVSTWHGSDPSQKFSPPERKSGSSRPKFLAVIEDDDNGVRLRIVLTGTSYAKLKYRWVSGGTTRRYATMTENWESKTSPGSIESGKGAGWVMYVDKKDPKPGIEPRMVDETLQDVLEIPFLQKIFKKYQGVPMIITSRAGVVRRE